MTAQIKCPSWCDYEGGHDRVEDYKENSLHYKHFGDTDGAHVCVWISIRPNGDISAKGYEFNLETATDAENMEEVALWCLDAAAFGREILGPMVTVRMPVRLLKVSPS